MKGFYLPKSYLIVVAIFAFFTVFGTFRVGNFISGLSMGCLFGCVASLIGYIYYAVKKIKVGVYLLSFIVLLAGFFITSYFNTEYT